MPRVDMNADGSFAVVYQELRNPNSLQPVWVMGRTFDANAQPLSDPFEVGQSPDRASYDGGPVVALSDNNTAIFVWEWADRWPFTENRNVETSEIRARRFDATTGLPLGDAFLVNTTLSGSRSNPDIAVAADGSFVIVWRGQGMDGRGVFMQRYDSAGNPLGSETRVINSGGYYNPQVAMAPDGRFVVTWYSSYDDTRNVFAQRFCADGSPYGNMICVSGEIEEFAHKPLAGFADNGDFVITWCDGEVYSRRISWNAAVEAPSFGPWIRSLEPTSPVAEPISEISLTFDRIMDPDTFDISGEESDVELVDPIGRTIPITSITTTNNQTFTIGFASQNLRGSYTLKIGPGIADAAGHLMNQNGDSFNGRYNDYYSGVIVLTALPTAYPFTESFECGSIDLLGPHWSFAQDIGTISISSDNPYLGDCALQTRIGFFSTRNYYQEAILHVDLVSASDMTLDFWVKHFDADDDDGVMEVLLSVDGTTWTTLVSSAGDPFGNHEYQHYCLDLDEELNALGLTYTQDIQIKFRADGFWESFAFAWDEIRIDQGIDVFGASVISQAPSGSVGGPISSVNVTFNEEMNSNSFTADKVTILGPLGNEIPLSGDPVDSGDHRTFTINLNSSQSLPGNYWMSIGPDILDLVGNPMNQDGNALQGDGHEGGFDIAFDPSPASCPYYQGFEDVTSLKNHWSFTSTADGRIQLVGESGNTVLRMDDSVLFGDYSVNEAIFAIDLAGQTGVNLCFNERIIGNTSDAEDGIFISDDFGVSWYRVDGLSGTNGQWQSRSVDLDLAIEKGLMSFTDNFWIKFQQYVRDPWGGDGAELDDIQVTWRDNESPTDMEIIPDSVIENEPVGTLVGVFSTSDPDAGDTFTYAFAAGTGDNNNSYFTIDGNQLRTAEVFDFSLKNSYSVRVETTDSGGLTYEEVFTISVLIDNPFPGDANRDGTVDHADAAIVSANWLTQSGAIWSDGDFNDDGQVNDIDATIMAANWQRTVSPPATSSSVAIEPEPVSYDLDNNGKIDLGDLAFFASVYREQPGVTTESPYAYAADFDHSGTVDLGDLALFAARYQPDDPIVSSSAPQTALTMAVAPAILPGDAHHDGTVHDDDAATLAANWHKQTVATWSHGDFNKDGRVTDEDVAILAQHWMMSVDEMDDNDDDERDAVFAEVGSGDDMYGLFDE